jgi:hypothetical protein
MTSLKELNDEITANAVELDFANRLFLICGYEAIERTATPVSAKSKTNRVYVPKDWTRVMVVKLE